MKIFNIVSEILKTILSILIPTFVIYLMFVAPQDNLIIGIALSILFFISLWFVLNYTLPQWVISIVIGLFVIDIGESIINNVTNSSNCIRNKHRRFKKR
jgi:hypothetical protein